MIVKLFCCRRSGALIRLFLSAGNFTTAMATHQQLVDYYATRPIIWTAVDETLTTTADTYGKN